MNIIRAIHFYALLPCVRFLFLRWVKFCSFTEFFFHLGDEKVVAGQVVILYSNDFMGICSDPVLVILDEWSNYKCLTVQSTKNNRNIT